MPSLQLRWWNLAGGGQAKADAATNLLTAWGGPPVGVGWPAAPAGGAPSLAAACEINGNLFVIPAALGGGVAASTASPAPSPANRWVAVKRRTNPAKQQRQKGYYGINPGPTRYDTGTGGAWTGVGLLQTRWSNYPGQLGGGMISPIVNRPDATKVRSRNTRRELIVTTVGPVIVAWYHAISGQGPATIYDLYEVLHWLTDYGRAQAVAGGAPRHVVLIGDLNLDPGLFDDYFDVILTPALNLAGVGSTRAIAPDEYAIVHSGTSTHNSGNELDYAIVMNLYPAPGAGPNIRAFIQCGVLAPGPLLALGGPAPGPGAFASLAFNGYQSDHRPIKFQLDY